MVSLALTPDTRWDISVDELAGMTKSAGFESLGILSPRATPDARAAFDRAGLRCHEIMALFISRNAEKTLATVGSLAESAALMGAPWVNTVFSTPPSAETAALVTRCAERLADAGTAMAVEFSPVGSLPTLAAGMEMVKAAGHGAAIMIDTWHFEVGNSSWDDLEAVPAEQIAYIQFSDGLPLSSDDLMAETMNHRVMPGDGHFSLERFATTVLERGFTGPVSAEVLTDDLGPGRSLAEFVKRAYDTTARYWL